ncbi:hypothetical protein BpHYR1_017372 [Brachionus plicatilis]|uniref:Uncharacterized protein n=1 Tax=Brachionus plicatilis TaxID=10195 RepID=A0A3M7QUQ0_BRAPC|nr:hypothetical protein BpHYR1_017372 [Brachionus plicatilis]
MIHSLIQNSNLDCSLEKLSRSSQFGEFSSRLNLCKVPLQANRPKRKRDTVIQNPKPTTLEIRNENAMNTIQHNQASKLGNVF